MADAPLLAIDNLDAFYGSFQALFGVSLRIEKGETIAIIGANGAGKTTLMKSIVGLVSARAGAIRFKGEDISGLETHRIVARGIALAPEGRRLFPSLTVEENLLAGGQAKRPGPWSVAKIYELFPVLGERRAQPSTSLSGGQQQMAAISRALMANPDLVLIDELSLGLAPIVIRGIYAALRHRIGGDGAHRRAGHRPGARGGEPRLLPARRSRRARGQARAIDPGRDLQRLFRSLRWTGSTPSHKAF
jgi:branched-chain amino acid transport system ATP-binding protein